MFASAGAKTNHLDGKMRQLIALEVSVTTRWDVCIAAHLAGAPPQLQRRRQMEICNSSSA
ncbi:carboxymuconolactone decarboxylase family protein [Rhizobium mesoamericanum]|uniref:carboxymuconolactone decarboxylase family protein n=1 Tax=Rhizobium mesoamericanum TaxID=1079800 RepID=UPI0027D92849|nr:carboxymuconolactone decarboxylase family protein [Rhizobium mesoamericanum]